MWKLGFKGKKWFCINHLPTLLNSKCYVFVEWSSCGELSVWYLTRDRLELKLDVLF